MRYLVRIPEVHINTVAVEAPEGTDPQTIKEAAKETNYIRSTDMEFDHLEPMDTWTVEEDVLSGNVTLCTNAGDLELKFRGKCWEISSGIQRDGENDAALDAIESMVLAHAAAGVDVGLSEYVGGINTALEAIANHEED